MFGWDSVVIHPPARCLGCGTSHQLAQGKSYRTRCSSLLHVREHPLCTPFSKGCEKVEKQFLETAGAD